ncbi:MAG: hypothetical protein HUU11_07175 [Anaerolineales bacterium]|nr:hypothetical protein [Anaerolineales bacterium]
MFIEVYTRWYPCKLSERCCYEFHSQYTITWSASIVFYAFPPVLHVEVERFGLILTVCHYPTGASKWNPIEPRLFNEISKTWAGCPLRTLRTILAKPGPTPPIRLVPQPGPMTRRFFSAAICFKASRRTFPLDSPSRTG